MNLRGLRDHVPPPASVCWYWFPCRDVMILSWAPLRPFTLLPLHSPLFTAILTIAHFERFFTLQTILCYERTDYAMFFLCVIDSVT